MYIKQLPKHNLNHSSKSKQYYGCIRSKSVTPSIKYRTLPDSQFIGINNVSHKNVKVIEYDQLDEYLLHRNHRNEKKVRNLKKEIGDLKNRLGECEKFMGKMAVENKVLRQSMELMKVESTRLSGNSRDRREDFGRNDELNHSGAIIEDKFYTDMRQSSTINKYLPDTKLPDSFTHKRMKSQNVPRSYLDNYNNLNYSEESDYQLLTPTPSGKLHQTFDNRPCSVQALGKEIASLVKEQSVCESMERRQEIRARILRVSQKLASLQRFKNTSNCD